MKVAAVNTVAAAGYLTTVTVALLHDNGIDLSDKLQDQMSAIINAGIGLTAAFLVQKFHDWLKHDTKTLAHENIALAQSAGETPSPIATATVGVKK